jgi:hypothetical protein
MRRYLADYVRNIILMRVGAQARAADTISHAFPTVCVQCVLADMSFVQKQPKHAPDDSPHEHDHSTRDDTGLDSHAAQMTPSDSKAAVVVVHQSPSSSIVAASDGVVTNEAVLQPESNDVAAAAIAAAITSRLQAEYMRPSRYTSNIAFDDDARSSIQKNIHMLLRGSSSSVALSSKAGHSPFVDRVPRLPHPPSTAKTAASAFAKRTLALGGAALNASAKPVSASLGDDASSGDLPSIAMSRGGPKQGGKHASLFPPLYRKRQ